jgi:hypothetical protein
MLGQLQTPAARPGGGGWGVFMCLSCACIHAGVSEIHPAQARKRELVPQTAFDEKPHAWRLELSPAFDAASVPRCRRSRLLSCSLRGGVVGGWGGVGGGGGSSSV